VIRVATFNARHANAAQTCRALDADVIALQELDRHVIRTGFRDQPRDLARALGYEYAFARAKHLGPGGRQCNALYARSGLTDIEIVELPRPRNLEPRNAIVARAGDISVACTHLQHRPRANAKPQLDAVLAVLLARPGPHVIAGDLNLATHEAVPMLEDAGLTPVVVGPTSPRAEPREQIDWIAFGAGLRLAGARVAAADVSDHLPLVATFDAVPA
jgi:endonuclease/exonuclease/phosphatase family metal-dependent hydrolase